MRKHAASGSGEVAKQLLTIVWAAGHGP